MPRRGEVVVATEQDVAADKKRRRKTRRAKRERMQENVKDRWQREIKAGLRNPDGTPKKKDKGEDKPKGSKPGKEPVPYLAEAKADANLVYGGIIQDLKQALGGAKKEGKQLDRAYDAYLASHEKGVAEHAALQQSVNQGAAGALQQGLGAVSQMFQGLQNVQTGRGTTDVAAGPGDQAAAQGVQAQAAQGVNVNNVMGQLGALANATLQGTKVAGTSVNTQAQAANSDLFQQIRGKLGQARREKGDLIVKQRGQYQADAANRQLAVQSLLLDNKKAQQEFQLAMEKLGLDKYLGELSASTTIATNDADNAVALEELAQKAKDARASRATQIQVASIYANASGGSGGGGGDGLTDSERKRGIQEVRGLDAAVGTVANLRIEQKGDKAIRKALDRLGYRSPAVQSAILAIAVGDRPNGTAMNALANLFPGGRIPPGLKKRLKAL